MVKVAFRKDLKSEKDLKRICKLFLDDIIVEKYEGAFEIIKPYFPVPAQMFKDIMEKSSQQLPTVKNKLGNSLGYGLVKEQKVGGLFIRYIYVQKFELSILRWQFTFYKPDKEWIISGLTFDDKQDSVF